MNKKLCHRCGKFFTLAPGDSMMKISSQLLTRENWNEDEPKRVCGFDGVYCPQCSMAFMAWTTEHYRRGELEVSKTYDDIRLH